MLNVRDFDTKQELAAFVKAQGITALDIQCLVTDDSSRLRHYLWWWTP